VSVDSFVAHALFDSGASYSFVSEDFVSRAGLSVQRLGHPILVSFANGSISSCSVCQGCSVILADDVFSANLVVISLGAVGGLRLPKVLKNMTNNVSQSIIYGQESSDMG
ncbi:retropepsin-like domain-containing protein, partial [Escherichia coli]|uniref:retropepsin-like aspartic protease n=1 Tax=Escherichia coli TaxID=562 RepID=UPI002010C59B|nr:retropepsin-like domain-containing protein [Escherichia coli]